MNEVADKVSCSSCGKGKAPLACGLCGCSLCKKCTHFLAEDAFSFLKRIPAELTQTTYCDHCFNEKVAPALAEYEQTMLAAKEIRIFYRDQRRETRLVPRLEEPYQVMGCADETEVLMRMAFWAIRDGFNSVLDVEVVGKKSKEQGTQRMIWSGQGLPAQVDFARLPKDKSFWHKPN